MPNDGYLETCAAVAMAFWHHNMNLAFGEAKYIDELEQEGKQLKRVNKLRNYKENLHYIFTEYQGSNITHWNFDDETSDGEATHAKSMTKNILLIADADIEGKGDRVKEALIRGSKGMDSGQCHQCHHIIRSE